MKEHYLAWKLTMAAYGIRIRAEDYYPLEGMGPHELAALFIQEHPSLGPKLGEIVQKKKQCYVDNINLKFYPDVKRLVADLKKTDVRMGIVTAGHLDQLTQSTPATFLGQFNALVTGDEFKRGKPYPDPYLKGAEKLNLKPEECIAVENAPLGVTSAKKAGIYCMAICSTVEPRALSEADEVIPSFRDLRHSPKIRKIFKNARI